MIISESETFYIINMLSFDKGFSHRTIETGTFNDLQEKMFQSKGHNFV